MEEQQDQIHSRQCEACQQVYPLTPAKWPRFSGTQQSYRRVCKACYKKHKQKKKMDRLEGAAIQQYLSRTVSGGSNIPHTAEMLESIMHYFGGANGFASILMKQYFESPPGSRMRNSILELVVRLASKNTEQGGAKMPVQLLSEDELESEINKRLEQAVLVYGGKRYLNAPQEASIAAGLPVTNGPDALVVPAGRTEDLAVRVEREAHRSLEAIQADAQAVGVSSLPVE